MIERGAVKRFALAWALAAMALAAPAVFGAQLGPAPELHAPPKEGQLPPSGEITRMAINNWSRDAVINYYNTEYLASVGVPSGWTGYVPSCIAGDVSSAYRTATTRRVNYYRGMCGLPPVDNSNGVQNPNDQEAALIFSANNALSHTPPSNWACYSANGYDGASHSNIALGPGAAGPEAVDLYMQDPGTGNEYCGHRRWILYPPQVTMGNGSVTPTSSFYPANALWVLGDGGLFGSRPTSPQVIAWPPPGFVPKNLIFDRWSFSYNKSVAASPNDHVNFFGATISMTRNGVALSGIVDPLYPGFNTVKGDMVGDHTIVWEPSGYNPLDGTKYGITINNVVIDGVARSFYYEVYAVDVGTASIKGAPTLLGWTDNGSGVLDLAWANGRLTPYQFLGFAYDIYAANWVNRGWNGTMWFPYYSQASTGLLDAGFSGGYHVWASNQYGDGSWYPSNAISGIEYSGAPHAPINVSASDIGGHTARLNWKTDIYGTWRYLMIVNNGSNFINVTGPSGYATWQAVYYPGSDFSNGRTNLTMPSAGYYTIYIQGQGWLPPYTLGAFGSTVVHVN
ncbi:MAG: CAP domain-containing protein [Candidatus Sumerlaeota bacterium]|nr:CAP domain-containing protein [Candidatus Sumerlaeota bacterium]